MRWDSNKHYKYRHQGVVSIAEEISREQCHLGITRRLRFPHFLPSVIVNYRGKLQLIPISLALGHLTFVTASCITLIDLILIHVSIKFKLNFLFLEIDTLCRMPLCV